MTAQIDINVLPKKNWYRRRTGSEHLNPHPFETGSNTSLLLHASSSITLEQPLRTISFGIKANRLPYVAFAHCQQNHTNSLGRIRPYYMLERGTRGYLFSLGHLSSLNHHSCRTRLPLEMYMKISNTYVWLPIPHGKVQHLPVFHGNFVILFLEPWIPLFDPPPGVRKSLVQGKK